jgi:hypothetical protein
MWQCFFTAPPVRWLSARRAAICTFNLAERTQNGLNFEFDHHVARPQEARKILGLAPP